MTKKINSKQVNVLFIFCFSPVTIDKSAEWGENNNQLGPNGAFLKVNEGEEMTISHLVQPNNDNSAPVGWVKVGNNRYSKAPIWIDEEPLPMGQTVQIQTLDGTMNYEVKENSYRCYNDKNGEADTSDCWVQTEANLKKNYDF
ncbi:MAG TPA: hypothetical protein PKC14_03610 [Candidatus Absconditabacterales bacterium]|nr:hypothetical protein [Candidatus Absconditabacterales bacterium]